jgi:FtsH-binding integral membrane protein
MALFGLIFMAIINIFWANSTMEWIVSFVGLMIFIGLTAWDTQRIKQMVYVDPTMGNGRLATIGALQLYLDFINMFLYLLRFLGNNRN